jgi:putative effector of murein hydrolase
VAWHNDSIHSARISEFLTVFLTVGIASRALCYSGAAFAALGIGLNGLLTAILVPFLAALWS